MANKSVLTNRKGWPVGDVARSMPAQRMKALKWFAERPDGVSTFGPDAPSLGTANRLCEVGVLDQILPKEFGKFVTYRINEFGRAVVEFSVLSPADLEILGRALANEWSDKYDLRAFPVNLQRLVKDGFLTEKLRPGKTTQYRLTKEGRKVLKGDYEQA